MLNFKKINHRHYIAIGFCVLMSLWSVFICSDSWIRLYESMIDFGTSIADLLFYSYDWCPDVTVNTVSTVDVVSLLPKSWVDIATNLDLFAQLFFTEGNFFGYLLWILPVLQFVCQATCIAALLFFIIFVVKKLSKPLVTNDPEEVDPALVKYKDFRRKVLVPVWEYLKELVIFFFSCKVYKWFFWILFLFSVNVVTVLIEFFAYYFYFCGTFDFVNIPLQVFKLSVDLLIHWKTLPGFVWLVIYWIVFDVLCRKRAYKVLLELEGDNKTTVKRLGLITLIVAPMRGGKTKLQSSMNVTKAQVVRESMLDNMLQVHSHFPHFPFERFIAELNKLVEKNKLKSLRLCEIYVSNIHRNFCKDPSPENLFGYDILDFPLEFDNGLVKIDIFSDLCVFVKSFSVYVQPTLFIGNYSIRELHVKTSEGNFPIWDFNLFKKPSFDGSGVFARKLNFDIIRPGKKLGDDKEIYGLLEYGLLCIQEADKEFGNKTETEEMKRNSKTANMKNDLHNKFFKTMGHAGMINYKATLSATMDSQRKSALGADTTELGLVCRIVDESRLKLTLPFFSYRDMFYRLFQKWHSKYKSSRWYNRADSTLGAYLLDAFLAGYIQYGEVIYNTFGYQELSLAIGDPSGEGAEELIWYEMNKKDKGGLYATDGLREMFRRHNERSGKGLSDLEQYDTLHPSLDTLKTDLNSFMINDFTKENKDETE